MKTKLTDWPAYGSLYSVKDPAFIAYIKKLFSPKVQLAKPEIPKDKISVAVHVVNLIRKAVRNKSGDSFFVESISGEMLPGGIDEILIVNHPVMQTSAWERLITWVFQTM